MNRSWNLATTNVKSADELLLAFITGLEPEALELNMPALPHEE